MPGENFDLDLSEVLLPGRDIHHLFRKAVIRVLVITDTEISISNTGDFGVGRFVRLLRESSVGCTRFEVDIAVRSPGGFSENPSPAVGQARYSGFRFDSTGAGGGNVIDDYHELFVFGFKPDNFAQSDANIDLPASLPATDAELQVLHGWMQNGGGIFATGDHDYLGASMCHRIARVGSMRQWTNADGVPPIDGPTRLDTNQPDTPGELAGTDIIPNTAERDATPQPIRWTPEFSIRLGWRIHKRPHPILCHPEHGVIDVMPDHPHEGRCNEIAAIDLSAKTRFDDSVDEYPTVGGAQPKPKIIARGDTVADPPYDHAKGTANHYDFPMISVYDGHPIDIGRVVVDSTWHHWFNLNIDGIETSGHPTNWAKISRYYLNVAVWLANKGTYKSRCWWELLQAHLTYPGIEELRADLPLLDKGRIIRDYLVRLWGPCMVTEFVLLNLCDLHPAICRLYEQQLRFPPQPDPWCLTCPPWEFMELTVLGGMAEGVEPIVDLIRTVLRDGKPVKKLITTDEIEKTALSGAKQAIDRMQSEVTASLKKTNEVFC